ncbi:tetratricopeptide repeat protein [Streptomyces sp. NPDC050560]|uniref:tetratricopeptide repeat protein n=1 Tax=Streptomyces sp. NPDC050560 TaxID=3365630 RepID=UPI00379737C6
MASDRGRVSRGELIRRRAQERFVGRQALVADFAGRLDGDPEDYEAPFLFHVHGLGGVGKSTLLRRWSDVAGRKGALTALVDESDVHGVPQALLRLGHQLARTGPLKEFDKQVEVYRREQAAASPPVSAGGEATLLGRAGAQAVTGAAALLPGGGVVGTLVNQDALAQGLDRAWSFTVGRGRRAREGDVAGLSRAFVHDLDELSAGVPWVVLFFDTWEQTGRYLGEWLRHVVQNGFGEFPPNVIVVLAGREELSDAWGPLQGAVKDVPLEGFTREETRQLLAARGVTDTEAVDAVQERSMGLPLLVELIARARPASAADVDSRGDAADAAVERFVRGITDRQQREAVLAGALPPELNEDVFAVAALDEEHGMWEWLCGQPFVSGSGDFKRYHAVVRTSVLRRQRTHSPLRWSATHSRLAEAHGAWRAEVEQQLARGRRVGTGGGAAGRGPGARGDDAPWAVIKERWADDRWRRHRLAESYHLLCASPVAALQDVLEQTVHAARQEPAVLRQWTDTVGEAARDTADPELDLWAERLGPAAGEGDPALACLTVLLTHGRLSPRARAWAHTYRGRHHSLVDEDERAIADLDAALALDPGNLYALAMRGQAHGIAGRHGDAMADLDRAVRENPADTMVLSLRGDEHRSAGRYDEAVADLTRALEIDPTDAWTLGSRGQAHLAADRLDEAVADFTLTLQLDATQAWVFSFRGLARVRLRHYDEAVADFTDALRCDSTSTTALAFRGTLHRSAGRYDEAVADLTRALEIDPDYTFALVERGAAHRDTGRFDEAVADLTHAIDVDPDYVYAVTTRGDVHRQADRYDEAVADFTRALELEPDDSLTLVRRGQAHRLANRLDEAVADFTRALDLDPEYAFALAHRGETRGAAGRYDEAVVDLTRALDLDPEYAFALASRGEVYRQTGRHDEAVVDLTRALDLDPEYAFALVERGVVHRQAGQPGLARRDFERAAALAPDGMRLRFELLLLDTLESGPAAAAEGWCAYFGALEAEQGAQEGTGDADERAADALFQVLFLEPGADVTPSTEALLAAGPGPDLVADLLLCLAELSAAGGELADRARHCRRLLADHVGAVAAGGGAAGGGAA